MRVIGRWRTVAGRMSANDPVADIRHPAMFPLMVIVAGELFPDDLACLTCAHVLNGSPVYLVARDADNEWQFLCDGSHEAADARVIALVEAVAIEPRLKLLQALGCNEQALLQP
jgi:hypothetical protein